MVGMQHEHRTAQFDRSEILVMIKHHGAQAIAAEGDLRADIGNQQVDADAARQRTAEIFGRHPRFLAAFHGHCSLPVPAPRYPGELAKRRRCQCPA
jgi:hypothetical protein